MSQPDPARVRLVRESDLELVSCPVCGSDNVLLSPSSCAPCRHLRDGAFPDPAVRKAALLSAVETALGATAVWVRHAAEHPGFVNRPSAAFWEALARSRDLTSLLQALYDDARAAETALVLDAFRPGG